MTTITIELPDKLAEEAKSHGLLAAGAVEAMIRESLRRRAAKVVHAPAFVERGAPCGRYGRNWECRRGSRPGLR